jgi:hypothetical protein
MLDKNALRRLAGLHRLARQIAASLPAEIYSNHALRVNERTDRLLKCTMAAAFSPRAQAVACEIARTDVCCSGSEPGWLAAALRLGGPKAPIVASRS